MKKFLAVPLLIFYVSSSFAIVRGDTVPAKDPLTHTVFKMISSNPHSTNDMDDVSLCTVSALTSRLVITAAHCVQGAGQVHRLEVVDDQGKVTSNKVLRFIQHEGFIKDIRAYRATLPQEEQNLRIENHDLALLLLADELPSSTIIAHLPDPEEYLDLSSPFAKLLAVGFGRITGEKLRDGQSGILRKAYVEPQGYHPTRLNFEIDQSQSDSKGLCTGDSGGPSYLERSEGLLLVGIAFSVNPYIFPGDENPDVCLGTGNYVNVQSHLGWIIENSRRLLQGK